jgi:hypothetical protein
MIFNRHLINVSWLQSHKTIYLWVVNSFGKLLSRSLNDSWGIDVDAVAGWYCPLPAKLISGSARMAEKIVLVISPE